MKKMIFLVALACLMLVPVVGQAYIVTVTDPVGDQIGQSGFDTMSITCNTFDFNTGGITFSIETNYPKAGIKVGSWQTLPADLLLDRGANGPGWDYAIPLVAHDGFAAGQLVGITSMYISDDFSPSIRYIFNHNEPVWVKTGTPYLLFGTWTWEPGTKSVYRINYAGDNWALMEDELTLGWRTAICANDIIEGDGSPVPTPEPNTLLLMGSGSGIMGFFLRKKLRMK